MASYTAMVTENHHADVYAKPIRALGQAGDTLVVISSSGNAANLIQAISAAHDRDINVIALTGRDGGDIPSVLTTEDIELNACVEHLDQALGTVTVPQSGNATSRNSFAQDLLSRCDNVIGIYSDQAVGTLGDRHGPFGVLPQRQARHTECRGLLGDTGGVC